MTALNLRGGAVFVMSPAATTRLIVHFENDLTHLIDANRSDDDVLREIVETMNPEEVMDGAKWSLERRAE